MYPKISNQSFKTAAHVGTYHVCTENVPKPGAYSRPRTWNKVCERIITDGREVTDIQIDIFHQVVKLRK